LLWHGPYVWKEEPTGRSSKSLAGGCVVSDVCLVFERRCQSFDLSARENRPEIIYHYWDSQDGHWPTAKKPDLIFFDPPYFNKLADQYTRDSISSLSRKEYLGFFREFFPLAREHSKNKARIAFLNADWPPARRAYAPEGETFREYPP